MFEYSKEESVLALREWILQESEFQTIATEAVRGLSGSLQNHHIARCLDMGTSEHFSVKQILVVILVVLRRKCHALIAKRTMEYGIVQNFIEEKLQIDGISLNIISCALAV